MIKEHIEFIKSLDGEQVIKRSINALYSFSYVILLYKIICLYSNCENPVVVVLTESMANGYHRFDILFNTNHQGQVFNVGDIIVFKQKAHIDYMNAKSNKERSFLQNIAFKVISMIITAPLLKNIFEIAGVPVEKYANIQYNVESGIPCVHRLHQLHQCEPSVCKKAQLAEVRAKYGKDYAPTDYFLSKGDNNNHDDRVLYLNQTLWLHNRDVIGKIQGYVPLLGMLTIWVNEYIIIKYAIIIFILVSVFVEKDQDNQY